MLILNASDVRQALPMRETIEAMKGAYQALSAGQAEVPLRTRLEIAPQQATALFMPAYVQTFSRQSSAQNSSALAVKMVTLFPNNPKNGLPFIHAAVLVMDPENGRIEAVLEGATLTAIRTGAGSGAATDLLARSNSRTAAIFGAGAQARTQLLAVCAVRQIERVWVYDPNPERVEKFIQDMAGKSHVPQAIQPAASPRDAAQQADIICAATTSKTPVFQPEDIRTGTHINGVGSYTPEMIEIPPALLSRARIFIDSTGACMAEAGEILAALQMGAIQPASLVEIGKLASGEAAGRMADEEITFFKCVGVAVQDAAAATLAVRNAQMMGLGQLVSW